MLVAVKSDSIMGENFMKASEWLLREKGHVMKKTKLEMSCYFLGLH